MGLGFFLISVQNFFLSVVLIQVLILIWCQQMPTGARYCRCKSVRQMFQSIFWQHWPFLLFFIPAVLECPTSHTACVYCRTYRWAKLADRLPLYFNHLVHFFLAVPIFKLAFFVSRSTYLSFVTFFVSWKAWAGKFPQLLSVASAFFSLLH